MTTQAPKDAKGSKDAGRPPLRISFLRWVVTSIYQADLARMAAALSYRTIFGLIPVCVLGLVVMGSTVSDERIERTIDAVMRYTRLSEIGGPSARSPEASQGGEHARPAPDVWSGPFAPDFTERTARLDDWIRSFVHHIRGIPFKAIGVLGVLVLIYAGISMIVEVEQAFNQIYRAPSGRGWGQRLVRYWAVLTLGPLLLLMTFTVSGRIGVIAEGARDVQMLSGFAPTLITLAGYLTTVAISTAMFAVLYIIVTNTKVRWVPALCGALLAALAWECLKWGFVYYLKNFGGYTSYSRYYGSIAVLPLFLFWIYVTWIVVLLGLLLAYSLQLYRDEKQTGFEGLAKALGMVVHEKPAVTHEPVVIDPAVALPVMGLAARRFAEGLTTTSDLVAQRLALPEPVACSMMEGLVRDGFLRRVESSDNDGGFVPARPASVMTIAEVLRCAHKQAGETDPQTARPLSPEQKALAELAKSRCEAAGSGTIEDFLRASDAAAGTIAQPPSPGAEPRR